MRVLSVLLVAALLSHGHAFYLPGVAPRKYVQGEQLMVKANTLTSDLTPLQVGRYFLLFVLHGGTTSS